MIELQYESGVGNWFPGQCTECESAGKRGKSGLTHDPEIIRAAIKKAEEEADAENDDDEGEDDEDDEDYHDDDDEEDSDDDEDKKRSRSEGDE